MLKYANINKSFIYNMKVYIIYQKNVYVFFFSYSKTVSSFNSVGFSDNFPFYSVSCLPFFVIIS